MRSSPSPDGTPGRSRWRQISFVLTTLVLTGLLQLESPVVAAHSTACSRIHVESRDRGVSLSSYVVAEPEYVAKMHALIDQNGQSGSWVVGAGELGALGYTVTYTCSPPG
jgi:hypothetical protein